MSINTKDLNKRICSRTVGLIWLTDNDLDFQSYGLVQFDYLLDGILTDSLQDQTYEKSNTANYFLGQNFGHPLFIGHVKVSDKKDLNLIDNHIKISEHFLKSGSRIFIFNQSKNTANLNILKDLKQKYPEQEFENLNL